MSTNNWTSFATSGGINISRRRTKLPPEHALTPVFEQINNKKGAVFSSGYDYPGRHSRWDIGFIDPALEIVAHGRNVSICGLNPQGLALLGLLESSFRQVPELAEVSRQKSELRIVAAEPPAFFTEEERSKVASVFSVLRAFLALFRCSREQGNHLGLYGAFGYDLIFQFENIEHHLKRSPAQKDLHLYFPLSLRVVDRKTERAEEIEFSVETPEGATKDLGSGGAVFEREVPSQNTTIQCDHQEGEFARKVAQVVDGTKRGDYFEVVLSQSFRRSFTGNPTELFQTLSQLNPSPYLFLLNMGQEQLLGSSPEIFCRVKDRRFETCPIAGTVRRGNSALEDAEQARQLILSSKDESELTMCTDVDRNDMARVCVPGSVKVIGRRQLEFYSHLIHRVDHLEGELAEEYDALDAFQTHMWACTVTGAPKPAAIQEIERLENSPRQWYSGAIGMLLCCGDLNTGITLRSALIEKGYATVRAGATLLYGSDPKAEEEETRTKAQAFLSALTLLDQPQEPVPSPAKTEATTAKPSSAKQRPVVLVDYRDSFVHNLAAYIRELGYSVKTIRHDKAAEHLWSLNPRFILLSPGPYTPKHFGMDSLIAAIVEREIPTFGVCLGFQGIGEFFGAELGVLSEPQHGKESQVVHDGSSLFSEIPSVFAAGRYHSLYLQPDNLPSDIIVRAKTLTSHTSEKEVIMAIEHRRLPFAGVQFHPESLMTLKGRAGHVLLSNAIRHLGNI